MKTLRLHNTICILTILLVAFTTNSAANLIVNSDFSSGNTGFSTDYSLGLFVEGTYGVYIAGENTGFFGLAPDDHTTGDGLMYLANGATSNALVWGQDVAVQQDTAYDFSMWAMTLALGGLGNNSDLEVLINGLAIGPVFETPFEARSPWINFTAQWNSGSNSIAELRIFERSLAASGNDFGLDDISLSGVPIPPAFYLFGSGLLGLIGISRRNKST